MISPAAKSHIISRSKKGVAKCIGYFDDKEAAARAYDEVAIERGLVNKLNFP